jgi:hypothetical protein
VFFPLQTYRSIVLGASRDSAKKAYLYAFMPLCRFLLADRLAPEALRPLREPAAVWPSGLSPFRSCLLALESGFPFLWDTVHVQLYGTST